MATDETRTRIIDAAGPIFAEKGFREATVREICEAAGVGLASVNYHFRDKQQLYVRVVEHAYEHLHAGPDRRLNEVPDGPAEQRLSEWVLRLARMVIIDREESWEERLFAREIQDPTPACEEFLRERVGVALKPLIELLDGILPAEVTSIERWRIAYSVLGQVLFYDTYRRLVRLMAGDDHFSSAFVAEDVAEHVTRFCGAALGLTPPLKSPDPEAPA